MVRTLLRHGGFRSAINVLFALSLAVAAQWAAASELAAHVTHLAGTLVLKPAQGNSRLLAVRSEVHEGDTLQTEDRSYARIKFVDGGEMVIKPNTTVMIERYRYKANSPAEDSSAVSLIKGGLRSVSGLLGKRSPEKVILKTKVATIGIRGTHYGVLDCAEEDGRNSCADIRTADGSTPPPGVHVDVAEGRIRVTNTAGEQEFEAGQFGYVRDAASAPEAVPAERGVRVSMPDSICRNNTSGNTVGTSRNTAACSM